MPEYHAKRSPSGGGKRMLYCAAAPEREVLSPDQTTRVDPPLLTRQAAPAQWGTASHLVLEKAIEAVNSEQYPSLGIHETCAAITPDEPYPEAEYKQMQEVAQVALDYVFGPSLEGSTQFSVRAESRVYPGRAIGVEDDLDGTADGIIITDSQLEVVDLKTGRGYVDASDVQLKYYAVGAMMEYIDPITNCLPFAKVRCTIVQPLGENPEAIRSHDYTPEELFEWMNGTVLPAYTASLNPNAVATPSMEGCKWCRVANCKERAEWVMSMSTQINQPVTTSEPHIPDISTLTDEQIQAIHDYLPIVQSFGRTIDQYISLAKKQDPARFPMLKFVPKLGNKTWALDEKTIEGRLKNQKFKKAQYTTTKLNSPTQMLKIANAKQKEYLQKLIIRPETGYKLVPVTDVTAATDPNTLGIKFDTPALPEAQAAPPLDCLN